MMKTILWLLCLGYTLTVGAAIAGAVEIQAAPVEQDGAAAIAAKKQSANIGPRDPEKEKAHGVGVDVFLSKKLAVCSSVSLLAPEPYLQTVQTGTGEGVGLNPSQLGGAVGLKVIF